MNWSAQFLCNTAVSRGFGCWQQRHGLDHTTRTGGRVDPLEVLPAVCSPARLITPAELTVPCFGRHPLHRCTDSGSSTDLYSWGRLCLMVLCTQHMQHGLLLIVRYPPSQDAKASSCSSPRSRVLGWFKSPGGSLNVVLHANRDSNQPAEEAEAAMEPLWGPPLRYLV